MRRFSSPSTLTDAGLLLSVAPACTPTGISDEPVFFRGFATDAGLITRVLLLLAEVAATRYVDPRPTEFADPIITTHGDLLRLECFSACHGVYLRVDLDQSAFGGNQLGRGATNVDLGPQMRHLLSTTHPDGPLHLTIGSDALHVATVADAASQRQVRMPARWYRSLGEIAPLLLGLTRQWSVPARAAQRFLASLPPVGSPPRSGYLTASPKGLALSARESSGSVHIAGVHRLSALTRIAGDVRGLSAYRSAPEHPTRGSAIELAMDHGRVTCVLTDSPHRGFSGEGALLPALANDTTLAAVDLIDAVLAFDAQINLADVARDTGLSSDEVTGALAVMAAQGRLGVDQHTGQYFHRDLPDDPARHELQPSRLHRARALVAAAAVEQSSPAHFRVGDEPHRHSVRVDPITGHTSCTCTWWVRHQQGRGPCAHILAARLFSESR